MAELGSINKAAGDVHLSQPALSRQIALLEHEVGTRLFVRARSGVTLTEAGKVLQAGAQQVLRQMALLRESVGKSAAGQVSIGMPPSMQRMVTAPLIERIARQRPEVAIRVHEALNDTLLELMRSSLVDLAIGAFDIAGVRGYRSTPLVREPLLVAGAAAAGLSARQPVVLARLRRERLILPSRPNVFRRTAEQSFKRAGHAMPMVIEAETVSLCLELARRGLGYTVMPFCALHENPAGRELSWAPVRGLYVTWALFENESRAGSPAVSGARGELIAQVACLFDKRQWPGAERVPVC